MADSKQQTAKQQTADLFMTLAAVCPCKAGAGGSFTTPAQGRRTFLCARVCVCKSHLRPSAAVWPPGVCDRVGLCTGAVVGDGRLRPSQAVCSRMRVPTEKHNGFEHVLCLRLLSV